MITSGEVRQLLTRMPFFSCIGVAPFQRNRGNRKISPWRPIISCIGAGLSVIYNGYLALEALIIKFVQFKTEDKILKYLAKATFRMARVTYHFVSFIKCVPFELEDSCSLRVKMFASPWKIRLWLLVNYFYWISVTLRFILFCIAFVEKPDDENTIVHGMYLMGAVLGCVFMVAMYMKPETCVVMLNDHDFLLKATHNAEIQIPHWTTYSFSILAVLYFTCALFGIWVFHGIYFLWRPDTCQFFYRFLPVQLQKSFLVYVICFITEQLNYAWNLGIMCAFWSFWCADIYTLNSILEAMLTRRRYTVHQITLYKYIEIFLGAFNDFNGTLFTVGFNFMITAQATIFIYLTIRATHIHPLIYLTLPATSVFSMLLIMYFLPQDARVRFQSLQLLTALRARPKLSAFRTDSSELGMRIRARNIEILNKQIRSFYPLGIKIGFFGEYTLNLSMDLVEQVCDNLLLLLSL